MVKFGQFCDKAVIFCYCALILCLPVSIALVESFSGGVIFFYVLKKAALAIKGENWQLLRPQGGSLAGVVAANILVVFISLFFSQFPVTSAISFFGKFMQGCGLYYSFVECFKHKRDIQWFMGTFAFSAGVVCLSGLNQYFFHVDFLRGLPLSGGRISSTFRQANDFGAYLIMIGALAMSFLFTYVFVKGPGRKHTPFLLAGMALLLVCLGLTFSRSSWLGFSVALLFAGLIHKRIVHSVLVILCFMALFIPMMESARHVSFVSDSTTTPRGGTSQTNISGMGRITFWKEAERIIRQFPLFGTGLNTYSKVAPGYEISWGGYPHNCYLQMAAEIGLIGLTSFLFLVGTLFWRTMKAIRTMRDRFLKTVVCGGWAGLCGFLLQSGLDTTLYSVQLANLMWIIMGLMVAAVAVDRIEHGQGAK